jgi:hypothetical protein
MTMGAGGFVRSPIHLGMLGTRTFSTNTPTNTPIPMPNQCPFVIDGMIRMFEVRYRSVLC